MPREGNFRLKTGHLALILGSERRARDPVVHVHEGEKTGIPRPDAGLCTGSLTLSCTRFLPCLWPSYGLAAGGGSRALT